MAQYIFVTSFDLSPQTLRLFLDALPEEFDQFPVHGGGYEVGLPGNDYAGVLIDSTLFEDGGTRMYANLKPDEFEYLQNLLGAPPKSEVSLELAGLPESYLVAVPLVKKMKERWGGILLDVYYKLVTERVFNP